MNKRKILIADDEKDIVDTIRFNLEFEGFECLSAYDGKEALLKAKTEKPDLIIMDVMMPEMEGYEVCQKLKSESETMDIPVIMVTAREEPADKIRGLELGAVDYIAKPFHAGELIARVATHIRIKELNEAVQEKNRQLQKLADKDVLTNLYTRRFFEEHVGKDLQRAQRYSESLSCMFIDIDHFKQFNDTYGHQAGDEILTTMGALIRDSLRACDLAARYGGEEFVAILYHADLENARAVAERLRRLVASHAFRIKEEELCVTISIGVAKMPPEITNLRELIDAADQALYDAKRNGRNRVEVFKA